MQKNSLRSQIVRNLGFDLTKSQEVAADLLADFFASKNYSQTFVLKGYAGTGKTTLISSCVRSLVVSKVKVILLAPTGRAAKVLSAYSGYPAYTIHRWIYRKQSEKDGFGKFVLNRNTLKNAVIIVDEASMINNNSFDDSAFGSGRLLDDLVQYVTSGHECKLMFAGDVAQLPPVRLDVSPALDNRVLESMGLDVTEITLGEVVRQAQDSGILYNATRIRNILESGNVEIPKFSLTDYNDVARISGADIIESIESSYSRVGTQDAVVINYSNKRANKYNQGIRSRILWREEELSPGDFLMVVKNSYFWVEDIPEVGFIANGDIVEVIRLYKVREMYGFRFADVLVRLVDYQQQELNVTILLDTLDIEGPSLSVEKSKELYANIAEEYAQIKSKKAKFKAISQDIHFNALQVKFAYAVTCQKAQGGQWKEVYIDQGFFKEDMISKEYLRWLYTALTRATDKVYFVNFNPLFFE